MKHKHNGNMNNNLCDNDLCHTSSNEGKINL